MALSHAHIGLLGLSATQGTKIICSLGKSCSNSVLFGAPPWPLCFGGGLNACLREIAYDCWNRFIIHDHLFIIYNLSSSKSNFKHLAIKMNICSYMDFKINEKRTANVTQRKVLSLQGLHWENKSCLHVAVQMIVQKTSATLGALADSQPQLDDHSIDDPFFTQVIWEVSGNKIKK